MSDRPKKSILENQAEDTPKLDEILAILFTQVPLIAMTTGLFLVLGLLYAFLWPPTYEGYATVKVPDTSQAPLSLLRDISPNGSKVGDPLLTFLDVADSDNVAYRVATALSLKNKPEFKDLSDQETVKKLQKVVDVEDPKRSNLISIMADSHDPQLAADMANTWCQCFIQLNLDLSHEAAATKRHFLEEQASTLLEKINRPDTKLTDESKVDELIYGQLLQNLQDAKLEENTDDVGIVVVDKSVVPEKPIRPKKILVIILSIFLGFLAGIQAAFLLDHRRNRLRDEEQIHRLSQLPGYALIPSFRDDYPEGMGLPDPKSRFTSKALIHNPVLQHSFYRESFKTLRTNLTLAQAGSPPRAIAVLSANPEEGKTLVNANLAIALAETGKKVLLVDVDLRKSSVHKIFELEGKTRGGVSMILTGQAPWKEMVIPSGIPNLDLLPNNVVPPNPAELLGSEEMRKLLQDLKKTYDFIVFDAPPILPVTDSVVLSTLLDGIVLLVRWNSTRSPELARALELLRGVKAPLIGTIFNHVPVGNKLYGGGYNYARYYGVVEKGPKKNK